jgi:hypothetical protein
VTRFSRAHASAGILAALAVIGSCAKGTGTGPLRAVMAGIVAQHLEWTAWSALGAHAKGIAELNQCRPDCVRGTDAREPVTIDLSGLRVTSNGDRCFTHIAFAIPGYYSGVLPTLGGCGARHSWPMPPGPEIRSAMPA